MERFGVFSKRGMEYRFLLEATIPGKMVFLFISMPGKKKKHIIV
jgi:hypothetical protein